MKIQDCRQCPFHISSVADCALCRYNNEAGYRAIFQGEVISCPRDEKRR